MTQRLKTKGLLERRRSKEDARAYVINLTTKGRRTLKSAEPLAERVNAKILQALDGRGSAFLDDLVAIAARLEDVKQTH
jgi:MarR family transcriptional regulator, temperature-dependent positive regulator of motility